VDSVWTPLLAGLSPAGMAASLAQWCCWLCRAGGSSSDRKRSRPIRAFSATPHDGQRPCRTLAEDPGRTHPRAASPALQLKREWSPKGIFCHDISGPLCPATQSGLYQPTCRLELNGKPECSMVQVDPYAVQNYRELAGDGPFATCDLESPS
jgi:hypothetical protein